MTTNNKFIKAIPTCITACRTALGVPITISALQNKWELGFWLLLIALSTDFLDGLAAKKLHAQTKIGGQLDRLADGSLVVFGFSGLLLSGALDWWLGITVLLAGLLIGGRWFFWPTTPRAAGIRTFSSVATLFILWIVIVWVYATHAFGWTWWYVFTTIVLVALSARLKKHRLHAWFHPPVK